MIPCEGVSDNDNCGGKLSSGGKDLDSGVGGSGELPDDVGWMVSSPAMKQTQNKYVYHLQCTYSQ